MQSFYFSILGRSVASGAEGRILDPREVPRFVRHEVEQDSLAGITTRHHKR